MLDVDLPGLQECLCLIGGEHTVIGPDGQRCARRINGMGGEFRPDLHGEEASQRAPLGPDRQIKRWEPTPWRA